MTKTDDKEDQGGNPFEDAEIIFGYTRKQAIEDGVLVDVSAMAGESGIRYPVALTANVWSQVIVPSDQARKEGQSESGRLWDVLSMLRVAISSTGAHEDTVHYGVLVRDGRQPREVKLKAMCGPGDDAEPVVTIMLPGED